MGAVKLIEVIAKHEEMKKEDLIKESLEAYLLEKKRDFFKDKFEILSRYNVSSVAELKKAIQAGKVAEHPTWEDLIEARNIDIQIKEIESDLRRLQRS